MWRVPGLGQLQGGHGQHAPPPRAGGEGEGAAGGLQLLHGRHHRVEGPEGHARPGHRQHQGCQGEVDVGGGAQVHLRVVVHGGGQGGARWCEQDPNRRKCGQKNKEGIK